MGELTGELLALRERLRTDTPFWAGGLSGGRPSAFKGAATVLNEDKVPVRLVARPWQARTPETPAHITPLDEALEEKRLAGEPARVIILKARKLGFSTWVQAKFMQRVSQFPFEYALTVAHLADSYVALAQMARLMYERLPSDHELGELIYGASGKAAPFSIRPQMVGEGNTRSDQYMRLGTKLRPAEASTYTTLTAGSKGGGRATTPSMLHLSEAAHYDDVDFMLGVLNAVPRRAGTIVVIESTANGFNHFHERWQSAVAGQEDDMTGGTYVPLFYGWQDNPANAIGFISEEQRAQFGRTVGDEGAGGDDEEILLVDEFGVSLEQLRWRRATIADEAGGSVEKFHQEHPATPEQAFIGSGQPVFPGILVTRMIRDAEKAPEPVSGVLRGVEWKERRTRSGTILVPGGAVWVPGGQLQPKDVDVWGDSRLVVWEHPLNAETQEALAEADRRPDGQYVAFADISTGQGNTFTPGDWHSVAVLDHVTRMQVAKYRSRVPLADMPLILVLIGLYFNEAILAPEVNGPGVAVVDQLKLYRYRRMYRRHRAGDDQRSDQREYLIGWATDTRTKPLMEATFGTILKEGGHGLRDVSTGREFTTYVEDVKNPAKHGAQKGSHDDQVISFMGAHRVASEIRPRDTSKRTTGSVRGRPKNRDPITDY